MTPTASSSASAGPSAPFPRDELAPPRDLVPSLTGRRFLGKCRATLRFARKMRRAQPTPAERRQARLGALRPIRRPVFILGCPRSGTTFLGELLEALPGASYFFEPPLLKYYTRLIYQGKVSTARASWLYRTCFRALLLAAPGHGPRLIEKNPNHTWIAPTLQRIFPDARFVILTRDGRDTALSLLHKPWHLDASRHSGRREPGGYLFGPYAHFYIEPERAREFAGTTDLHRCLWIWRRHAEQIERLRTDLPAESQFHLRYETLIRQPRETLHDLLEFLDERSDAARQRVLEAAGSARDTSIGRWRSTFKPADLALVDQEAGPLLRQLGY